MKKIFSAILLLGLSSITSFGQYGDEWVNSTQSYYKFKIGVDGVYRISQSDLTNAGVPISTLDPTTLKIYLDGNQIPIYISGEGDGSFDAVDYIEFYGVRNDGRLDEDLYTAPSEHGNPFYSLYQDSSVYFLTWSSAPGLRFSPYQDNNFIGSTPESHFMYEATKYFGDFYFDGRPNGNNLAQLFSEYDGGEGFFSDKYDELTPFDLATPQVAKSVGIDAALKVYAFGRNNSSEFVNGYNHGFGVAIGSKSNLLTNYEHNGYSRVFLDYNDLSFSTGFLDETTSVYLGEVERTQSLHVISYFQLRYPRLFNLSGNSQLKFESIGQSRFVEFANYNDSKSNPIILDLTNQQRINGVLTNSNELRFNTSTTSAKQLVVFDDSDTKKVSGISKIELASPISSNTNYLIITNHRLKEGAQRYADYRASSEGGNLNVSIVYVDDLFNSNYFGYRHPMAIRNFIQKHLKQENTPIQGILLLGKGQWYKPIRKDLNKRDVLDLVPTLGSPPSDYLFVSSLDKSDLTLDVPIGRVAARNNSDIDIYLAKVKAHESQVPAEWQKQIVQIAGGNDAGENTQFQGYLQRYYNIAKDSFIGAQRVLFSKDQAVAISSEHAEKIQQNINNGVNYINYFGHGAAQVLDVDLGDVNNLKNEGKYPFFIFNGCALGNSYVDNSLGELYLFAENKGAINWLASTGFGFTNPLISYTTILHEEMCINKYGESIGSIIQATLERYADPSNAMNVMNSRQLMYQGDPALKIHSPEKPDYTARNGYINTSFSTTDDISIIVDLVNLAKATNDTIEVLVQADNGDSVIVAFTDKILAPKSVEKDTFSFERSDFYSGLVTFTVKVDYNDSIDELQPGGELNNSYVFEQVFELKKPLLVYPTLNSIVETSTVDIVCQIVNPRRINTLVTIELDTSLKFDSPSLIQKIVNTSDQLVQETIALPPLDGFDFYYRVKTEQEGKSSDWSTSSFAYLFKDPEGWSESHYSNLQNISTSFMRIDTASKNLEYTRRPSGNYLVFTNGGNNTSAWNLMWIAGEVAIIRRENSEGIQIAAVHPNTELRINYDSKFNRLYPPYPGFPFGPYRGPDLAQDNQLQYYQPGKKTGVYNFKTANKEDRDSLIEFLQNVPDGYHIIMHNELNHQVDQWEQAVFDELEKFGITNLKGKLNNEPFALFGTKGDVSQSKEIYADYSSGADPKGQYLELATVIYPKVQAGSLSSEKIGPATSWAYVDISMKDADSPTDDYSYTVFGIDTSNKEKVLYSNLKTGQDLTSVNPVEFPYLRLTVNISDSSNYTPMTIDRWKVHYTGVSEIMIDRDHLDYLSADTVARGQDVDFGTAIKNISNLTFDSSTAQMRVIDINGTIVLDKLIRLDSIGSNDIVTYRDTINTTDLSGQYQIILNANYDRKNVESEYRNNLYSGTFFVTTDNRNPILDVTFDGRHIFNRDIVSSSTLINITGKDENPWLLMDDPALFVIELREPGSTVFDTIRSQDPRYTFTASQSKDEPANIAIQNDTLKDGIYTLRVTLMDRTGNGQELEPYLIDFKIVTEQTISNVYVYPNPFTTCGKFVFTCTGVNVPEQMQIQIFTISGRLVKTINQNEMGPINIGNNVTEYCWDGTDDFGDRLANGVYLYRVTSKTGGEDIESFETTGDQFFQDGWGKLYIAR